MSERLTAVVISDISALFGSDHFYVISEEQQLGGKEQAWNCNTTVRLLMLLSRGFLTKWPPAAYNQRPLRVLVTPKEQCSTKPPGLLTNNTVTQWNLRYAGTGRGVCEGLCSNVLACNVSNDFNCNTFHWSIITTTVRYHNNKHHVQTPIRTNKTHFNMKLRICSLFSTIPTLISD
jgi:hypothetical protein